MFGFAPYSALPYSTTVIGAVNADVMLVGMPLTVGVGDVLAVVGVSVPLVGLALRVFVTAPIVWGPVADAADTVWDLVAGAADTVWSPVADAADTMWSPVADAADTTWSPIVNTPDYDMWVDVPT